MYGSSMGPFGVAQQRVVSPELTDHHIETLLGSSFGTSEDAKWIAQKTLTNLEQPRVRALLTGVSTCGDLPSTVG
jgi:hypothetical protein